jgi:hypothetical protein
MSFIYYSPAPPITFGPSLVAIQLQSTAHWTTPDRLIALLEVLTTLDFQDFDSRQRALASIDSVAIPQFFYAYPFDPLTYPLIPPRPQVRFPADSTYVELSIEYQTQFIALQSALSYREPQDPSGPQTTYSAALLALQGLNLDQIAYYDRAAFELENLAVWSIYPPPPPLPTCLTHHSSPPSH